MSSISNSPVWTILSIGFALSFERTRTNSSLKSMYSARSLSRDDGEEINIKIVDTPGLGDTCEVLKDNETIKQFEDFFHSTLELDYILVTIK